MVPRENLRNLSIWLKSIWRCPWGLGIHGIKHFFITAHEKTVCKINEWRWICRSFLSSRLFNKLFSWIRLWNEGRQPRGRGSRTVFFVVFFFSVTCCCELKLRLLCQHHVLLVTWNMSYSTFLTYFKLYVVNSAVHSAQCCTNRKKIKFYSYARKFRMDRSHSHTWLTASSYMVKNLRISSYIRKLSHIYDPIWISLCTRWNPNDTGKCL